MSQRFLTMKEVLARVSLSKTELYRRIRAGTFPAPIRLGLSRIAFVEKEVEDWMAERAAARSTGGQSDA